MSCTIWTYILSRIERHHVLSSVFINTLSLILLGIFIYLVLKIRSSIT